MNHLHRIGRISRTAGPFVAGFVLLVVLLLAVFPTRAYVRQRQAIDTAETRAAVLTAETKRLQDRVTQLQDDTEIERIAREQYNLVKPGEEAYAILPPPKQEPGLEVLVDVLTTARFWAPPAAAAPG